MQVVKTMMSSRWKWLARSIFYRLYRLIHLLKWNLFKVVEIETTIICLFAKTK